MQSLLKRRFGEHDETDLVPEIESFERHVSSDLISEAIKHGIVCGGMVHQGLKQHLSTSRLSTYKALRGQIQPFWLKPFCSNLCCSRAGGGASVVSIFFPLLRRQGVMPRKGWTAMEVQDGTRSSEAGAHLQYVGHRRST